MENTALNGTTNATKDHEDWKKKKGYGPILVVAVSLALLLGLSAYSTGGPVDGGTTLPPPLHRDENGMTNAVASSSSTSLVGSGTAQGGSANYCTRSSTSTSLVGSLVGSGTAQGGSSAYCKKNTGYNCGAVFPPDGDTCGHKGCCCRQEDGTGYKLNTCDGANGYAYRGCNSCLGECACFATNNVNIGDSSCHGPGSCNQLTDSTIDNASCHSNYACDRVKNSTIHAGSCQGLSSCIGMSNSIIGEGSCTKDGDYHVRSCQSVDNVKIGNNSCNGLKVCCLCKHNVPDNACNLNTNQGSTDDLTEDGYCKFCGEKSDNWNDVCH